MATTLQQQMQVEAQPQEKTLYVKYWRDTPRGTMAADQQFYFARTHGLEAYFREYGYTRLQDHLPGVVEMYDRGKPEGQLDQFLIIAHVRNPGQPHYIIVFAVESFELLMMFLRSNLLVSIPLLPETLHRYHAIQV